MNIGIRVLSYSLRSGGALGSGGRMTLARTAECVEEVVGLMGGGTLSHAAAAKLVTTWVLPVSPSMRSPALWRVPGKRLIGVIAGHDDLCSHRPDVASDLSWALLSS